MLEGLYVVPAQTPAFRLEIEEWRHGNPTDPRLKAGDTVLSLTHPQTSVWGVQAIPLPAIHGL
jgi:hypothetical protein